ncbi:MAG: DUF202 domain-containing protein [Laribacter sp.]|nr:DUF202 domain-containing protein [Laribacter sp.]
MNNDPRVYSAAERTLLAWVRTGIAIMAMGFVISRFGLFLALQAFEMHLHATVSHPVSGMLGFAFAALGATLIAIAAVHHARYTATLGPAELPPAYPVRMATWLALLMAALGAVLAGYLLLSAGNPV